MNNLIALLVIVLVLDSGYAWTYFHGGEEGPENWHKYYDKCSGDAQSPIDIKLDDVEVDENLGNFDRHTFASLFTNLTLHNNGHVLQVDTKEGAYTIKDRNLLHSDFKIDQFHFHWSSDADVMGSEHAINGKRYFAEMHLVHYNTKYPSIGEAVSQPDGLAVLGIFVDATYPQDNLAFHRILELLTNAKNPGDEKILPSSNLFSMETILPCDLSVYYRYKGSLTSPTCDESVTWTVFKEPIRISRKQANMLAKALTVKHGNTTEWLKDNYRPLQNLNGRKVTKPMEFIQGGSASSVVPMVVMQIFLAVGAWLMF